MADLASKFIDRVEAAADALEAGNPALALRKARAAQALLAGIPDGGRNGTSMTWGRQMLPEIIQQARQAMAEDHAAGGGIMQDAKVHYQREGRRATTTPGDFG